MNNVERYEKEVFPLIDKTVKAYRGDMEHDKTALSFTEDDTPFIIFARETGTHIQVLVDAKDNSYWPAKPVKYLFGHADRLQMLEGQVEALQSCEGYRNAEKVVFFDGKKTQEITAEHAIGIYLEYARQCKRIWEAERKGIAA